MIESMDMGLIRFYWLLDGALAGCSRPGARHERSANGTGRVEALEADLADLRERDIGAVLTLTEEALPAEALARQRLEALHVPVRDMTAPEPEELARALGFIDVQRALGRAVAVHCLAGQGRTGTVLAAYLVRNGATPDAAIARVRAACPGALEVAEQVRAVQAFARRRDWVV